MIVTRTPLRISLIGGGSDMPSFYKKHPGMVISFAIDKYVYVSVNKKFDGKLRVSYSSTENVEDVSDLKHDLVRETLKNFKIKSGLEITSVADIPGTGTGLGSSSAFTVGLVKALGRETDPATVAERAFYVEAESCHRPVGKQDQYASAFGGFNQILFGKNRVAVTPLLPSHAWISDFESHALLLWTGMTRDAGEILKAQDKAFRDGGNLEYGKRLVDLAHEFHQDLMDSATMDRLGTLLHISWITKKGLARGVSNQKIDDLYTTALSCGAHGGKLLGAGGGGFLFFLAPPERHGKIVEATGLRKVDFKIEQRGSEVIYDG